MQTIGPGEMFGADESWRRTEIYIQVVLTGAPFIESNHRNFIMVKLVISLKAIRSFFKRINTGCIQLHVIRIQWDLKNNSDYAEKIHWFWSI